MNKELQGNTNILQGEKLNVDSTNREAPSLVDRMM